MHHVRLLRGDRGRGDDGAAEKRQSRHIEHAKPTAFGKGGFRGGKNRRVDDALFHCDKAGLADLDDGDVFVRVQSELLKQVAHHQFGDTAEADDADFFAFKLLDVFDLGPRHHVVFEGIRLGKQESQLDAMSHRLQRRHRRAHVQVNVVIEQRTDRRRPAGDKNQLDVESLFLEQPGALGDIGNPRGVAGDGGVGNAQFVDRRC